VSAKAHGQVNEAQVNFCFCFLLTNLSQLDLWFCCEDDMTEFSAYYVRVCRERLNTGLPSPDNMENNACSCKDHQWGFSTVIKT